MGKIFVWIYVLKELVLFPNWILFENLCIKRKALIWSYYKI